MKPWWGRETGVKGGVTPLGLLFWADQTKLAGSRLVEVSALLVHWMGRWSEGREAVLLNDISVPTP